MADRIKSVSGEGQYPLCYAVGHDGVTSIFTDYDFHGEYGISWFCVKKGDHIVAKMNARYVASIEYFPPETPNNDI